MPRLSAPVLMGLFGRKKNSGTLNVMVSFGVNNKKSGCSFPLRMPSYDIKHLMTGPKGNSEFYFPETLNVPQGKPRGTLRAEGKQNSLFPEGQVIKCFIVPPVSKKNCEQNDLLDCFSGCARGSSGSGNGQAVPIRVFFFAANKNEDNNEAALSSSNNNQLTRYLDSLQKTRKRSRNTSIS